MPPEWLTDKADRKQVEAYVFGLLRTIGREPARSALLNAASKRFGTVLREFLASRAAPASPPMSAAKAQVEEDHPLST